MKNYISWLDLTIGDVISQPMQRVLMEDYSKKIKGKIIFELGEDTEFGHLQLNFSEIIRKKSNADGFIFYRLEMFRDKKKKLKIQLLRQILKKGYELHFVRQNLPLKNMLDMKKNMNKILLFQSIS